MTPAGVWVHHALVRENGLLTIYMNGAADPTFGCSSVALPIAALGRGNAGFLGGQIDDLQIHTRALRPSEIAALAR